jgi:hypothetical protein
MRKLSKREQKWGWLFALGFFIVPHVIVIASGSHETTGRILAEALGMCSMLIAVFWIGLSPNSGSWIFRPGAKLNRPGYSRARFAFEVFFRAVCVFLGAVVVWFLFLPFLLDLIGMSRGEQPMKTQGQVVVQHTRRRGWFLCDQFGVVDGEAHTIHLYRFYSLRPVKDGGFYDFTFLPRSKIVLNTARLPD